MGVVLANMYMVFQTKHFGACLDVHKQVKVAITVE